MIKIEITPIIKFGRIIEVVKTVKFVGMTMLKKKTNTPLKFGINEWDYFPTNF